MHVWLRAASQFVRQRLSPRGLSPRALSTALIAALSGFLIAALLFAGWRDYESSQMKAEIKAAGATRVMESELRGLVTTADLALRHIASTGHAAPEQLDKVAGLLPAKTTLSLFGVAGELLYSTAEEAGVPAVGSAAEILAAFRAGATDLHIGPLEPTGGGKFVVARALRNRTGEFRGIIQAALPGDAIGNILDSIDIGPDSVLATYRTDGALVFRRPRVDAVLAGEKMRGSRAVNEPADRLEGVYRNRSVVDGVDRIIAYRRLPDLGLMVVAGPSVDHSLADTRGRLRQLALFAAPAVMLSIWVIFLAMRSINREAFARVEAHDANQSKLHFISGTYHDLGQILLALDLFLSRLRETVTDEQLCSVEGADAAVRSAHDLLDSMMDASHLASGGVRVFVSEVHVRDVLDRIAVEVEPRASRKGLRLTVHGSDCVALSDPHLLERIVRNLVVNAIKFTSVGGVLIACRRVGDEVSIEVWDTGPGIPEVEHKEIFNPFHRVGRPLPARGMGLGLSIVDRFATLLGHPISLRSRLGRGSVFKLRLKLAESNV